MGGEGLVHNVYVRFCGDGPKKRQYWPRIGEGEKEEGNKYTKLLRGLWLVRKLSCREDLPDAAARGTGLDARY